MKIRKLLCCILFICYAAFSNAQDISGRWVGVRTSGATLTLDIIQVKDSIYGIAFIIFPDEIGRANIAFTGNIHDGVMEYETTQILEQEVDSNILLCFVTGKDFLKIKKRKHILEGACISIDKKEECFNISCIERYEKKLDFAFSKQRFMNRKVLVVDTVYANQDTLELKVWDNLKEDGDIVSVYINEQNILSQHLLRHQAKSVKLICTKTWNEVIFYAHNLGSEPPNTASIGVYQNGKLLKELDIKSDADKCESFVIKRQ